MERNAHYALVGLISLMIFVGAAVFAIWLAKVQFAAQYSLYDVDFAGPVRGLSAGGQVFFNGIKVGEVTKLSLDKANPNRVVARIRTTADTPVRVDSYGSLEPLGVTGVNYIQITAGTTSKPLLRDVTPPNQIPVIRTKVGALEGLLQGGGDVLARTVDALDRVNRVLSDRNIAQLSGTLEDVHDITTTLRSRKQMIDDLDRTIRTADLTAQKIGRLTDDADRIMNGDVKLAVRNASDAAAEIKGAATDVRGIVGKLQGPTTDFATTGLPQLTRAVIALQQAAESLDRVVGDIEQNPRGLISKAPARTVELKP